jgi:hypothetical protein
MSFFLIRHYRGFLGEAARQEVDNLVAFADTDFLMPHDHTCGAVLTQKWSKLRRRYGREMAFESLTTALRTMVGYGF